MAESIAIPSFLVRHNEGNDLWLHGGSATVSPYSRPMFDGSTVILFLLAVGCIIGGAWWSSENERASSRGEEIMEDPDVRLDGDASQRVVKSVSHPLLLLQKFPIFLLSVRSLSSS